MHNSRLATGLCALILLACGCGGAVPERAADQADDDLTRTVFVVNYPLEYLAARIGGADVVVEFPAPPDVDPAFWSPAPETVLAYQQADLILLNGAGYARWMERVTLPDDRLVDTSTTFADRVIAVEDAPLHTHGPGGEHSHGELAFTTWLDPQLALEQARVIRTAFSARWPGLAATFEQRFADLATDLGTLDARLAQAFAAGRGVRLLASHPVYQYLARRYELDVVSMHWEPGEDPGPGAFHELRQILAERPAPFMLWEGPPLESVARSLREAQVEPVVFEPCGNTPATGDLLDVMGRNAQAVEDAF